MGGARRGLGRSEKLRKACAKAGLAYVAIIPRDYLVTMTPGTAIRAGQAVTDAAFERRSCGNGPKGPRYSGWAMTETGTAGQYLLIRRLISRPDSYTFYLCWAPPGRPATTTYFITIAGRRWPVEETFKTGKDMPGWDQAQARTWNGICRHTALAALAQLRAAAIRGALTGSIAFPSAGGDSGHGSSDTLNDDGISDADLQIPPAARPSPPVPGSHARPASPPSGYRSPRPSGSPASRQTTPPGCSPAHASPSRCAGPARRRRHQATARWHHYSNRLLAASG